MRTAEKLSAILVALSVVVLAACSGSAEPVGSTQAAPDRAATASLDSDGCEDYVAAAIAVSQYASDISEVSGEVFVILGDTSALMALVLDDDLVDQLIDMLDGASDQFAFARRELPAAPPQLSETDGYLRTALADYESGYSTMAAAFREFKRGDFAEATTIIDDATDDINSAAGFIQKATAAIPPTGC